MKVKGETAVYHVVSSPTLEGFVPGDREKDFLLSWIVRFLLHRGPWFSIMGNHFHLLVRMQAGDTYSDEEVRERYERRYGEEKGAGLDDDQMRGLREKMSDLSEYVKEIKQGFSRYYNKVHRKKGYFWSERFKSVIVENGETLINCLYRSECG